MGVQVVDLEARSEKVSRVLLASPGDAAGFSVLQLPALKQ